MARVLPNARTVTSCDPRSDSTRATDSRYGKLWIMTACLAAAAWSVVAITQSPLVPLSLLVLSLSLCGGMLAVQAPRRSAFTKYPLLRGAVCASTAVLVTVGIGHHFVAGLVTVAMLAATSPALVRRIGGGTSR